jgi:hypothetical protein
MQQLSDLTASFGSSMIRPLHNPIVLYRYESIPHRYTTASITSSNDDMVMDATVYNSYDSSQALENLHNEKTENKKNQT